MAAIGTLGFVGTGTIAAAMIEGLALSGSEAIVVSPRNADIAAGLAARFPNVTIAADNQAVVDASDMVVLSVRPQIADEVLRPLAFRADQHVLSLIATISLDYLHEVTAPAATVTRAVPLPPVARGQGPTAMFPPNAAVKALYDRLGTAIELTDESEFDVFSTVTATMGAYFAFAHTIAAWMVDEGVDAARAHAFTAQLLEGLGSAPRATPGKDFAELADEHQTRGGINEQVFRAITRDGVLPDLDAALDGVLARLRAGRGIKA
ncbi:pyrroline-5-carboxylate reductase [Sphingomonas sp.]|uniref:pyrroline-5-carboxylate reductase n=1 Tax=Sphingomonas sp. TaxID=28214 RepID=UPI0025D3DC9A|nr:pyrroline-5-carboxylate reductase [Sphingomonas sp.]